MEKFYLKNGQECIIKYKIDDKYIVDIIYDFEDENGNIVVIETNSCQIVDEVFKNPPVKKFASEIIELEKNKNSISMEIIELEKKKRELEIEVESLNKTQIQNSKFIIDRSELINAKTIVFFKKGKAMPTVLDSKDVSFKGLRVSLDINIYTGETSQWGAKIYEYNSHTSGDAICPQYGILINPTQEDIDAAIINRLFSIEFSDRELSNVPDMYLTGTLLDRKKSFEINDLKEKRGRLEKERSETQKKLDILNKSIQDTEKQL